MSQPQVEVKQAPTSKILRLVREKSNAERDAMRVHMVGLE
jgi:hypothetical protein